VGRAPLSARTGWTWMGIGCDSKRLGRADLFNEQELDPQSSSLDNVGKRYKKVFMRV